LEADHTGKTYLGAVDCFGLVAGCDVASRVVSSTEGAENVYGSSPLAISDQDHPIDLPGLIWLSVCNASGKAISAPYPPNNKEESAASSSTVSSNKTEDDVDTSKWMQGPKDSAAV